MRKAVIIVLALFAVSLQNLFSQEISLNGKCKFHVGDNLLWAEQYFDDSNWESITIPAAWEDEGFHGYDGFAWYRIKFDGTLLDSDFAYFVKLGYIDDVDQVYLNGEFIAFSGSLPPKFKTAYNSERQYALPTQLINFKGSNTLAIRVFDGMLGGGIVHGNLGIYRYPFNERLLIDLQGIWSFATAKTSARVTDERAWKNIMAPSPWEYQGYYKYDGFAWYKKSFTVSASLPNEQLVLCLGKIDDFDKVYLNGQFIGSTGDNKEFGSSESWLKDRVYEIPNGLLKKNAPNTIEVMVKDIGNIGGIYEGPLGITTKANYEKYFKRTIFDD